MADLSIAIVTINLCGFKKLSLTFDLSDKIVCAIYIAAASPIDLECHIQAERITKLLDEAIYKIKLSICLPRLVHEFKTLNSTLTVQHLEDLVFIFEQYENPLFSTSLLNIGAMEDIKGVSSTTFSC